MYEYRSVAALGRLALLALAVAGCPNRPKSDPPGKPAPVVQPLHPQPPPAPPGPQPQTFAARGDAARNAIEHDFYAADVQKWHMCSGGVECPTTNVDWGADDLTYDLWFRYSLTKDATLVPLLAALNGTGPKHKKPCRLPECHAWSDVPEWDSLAASREYEATHDAHALERAKEAFDFVDQSDAFWFGGCPDVAFQHANAGGGGLKTLETDSNYVKAALVLFQLTKDNFYLKKAVDHYAAIRRHFLDAAVPLYTVWLVDDKRSCPQIPRRFFGSVNGNMILNGLVLADLTHKETYREEALATAKAFDAHMNDPSGIFENLLAENDVGEPLVEAFYELAAHQSQPFARAWILRNADAAASARAADGSFGRFWGGPRPRVATTAFMANGGFALAFAAAALAPDQKPAGKDIWATAKYVQAEVSELPAQLEFTGQAIALIGTIGEHCCEKGHAHLYIDGAETFDRTGIWQNKDVANRPIPESVLFAWRWPESGHHKLEFKPGEENPKEGHSFLHIQGYDLVP